LPAGGFPEMLPRESSPSAKFEDRRDNLACICRKP